MDEDFYSEWGQYKHNQNPQSPKDCISLITSSPTITYLNHESTTVKLTSPSGPRTTFKLFGSPYSPRSGLWGFSYEAPQSASPHVDLTKIWDDIPLDTDIVVTHTPPRLHRDERVHRRVAAGCEALRRSLWRVRPRLAICGHVHDARGAERVSWDLSSRNIAFAEASTTIWEDPAPDLGSKKISLVDLTGRKAPSLANDGSHHTTSETTSSPLSPSRATIDSNRTHDDKSNDGSKVCSSTIGLGGDPSLSGRCDVEALCGRMGRKETCIVNAAIMKTSYPHEGGKQYNKPIVVDLDLPVWHES